MIHHIDKIRFLLTLILLPFASYKTIKTMELAKQPLQNKIDNENKKVITKVARKFPLHQAALERNVEAAKQLIQNGFAIDEPDDNRKTPYDVAEDPEMINLLRANEALFSCSVINTIDTILKDGAHLEARNWRGYTPLLYMMIYTSPWVTPYAREIIKKLLEKGANANVTTL